MIGCPWDAYARAQDVGCEPDVCAWIVHPAEAWSNLAFFAVALALIVRHGRADHGLPVAWFPWIVVAIGFGSFAFHASMIHWFHAADVAAIFLFTAFLLAAYLQHAGLTKPKHFVVWFVAFLSGGLVLTVVDPRLGWGGIAAQGAAFLWVAWRLPVGGSRRTLIAALALNQAAAAALWLDKGQVACVRGALGHVVQPHSFWHVLSALSLAYFCRYEREIEHRLREGG